LLRLSLRPRFRKGGGLTGPGAASVLSGCPQFMQNRELCSSFLQQLGHSISASICRPAGQAALLNKIYDRLRLGYDRMMNTSAYNTSAYNTFTVGAIIIRHPRHPSPDAKAALPLRLRCGASFSVDVPMHLVLGERFVRRHQPFGIPDGQYRKRDDVLRDIVYRAHFLHDVVLGIEPEVHAA
jgi:hypothetical protein